MIVPFVIAAALAAALLAMLALSRRSASAAALVSAEKEKSLDQQLRAERSAHKLTTSERDDANQQLISASAASEESTSRAADAAEQLASLKAVADELSESEQQSAERIAVLEIDVNRLRDGMSEIEPQVLWELELQRSERTWRHCVSVSPDHDESPFATAEDPLRTAIEIEAAALKEEAGAFLSVDWQAAPVEDPARSHLILRLAQEMLAAASRDPIPACLTVAGTGAVTLTMEPSEDEDEGLVLDLRAPEVSGELIEIDARHPARITVSYA